MDRYDEYVQVLTLCSPPIEALGGPKETPELARLGNDGMAELCVKHPDRFPGFVASLPMNNPEAALAELDRALMTLGATGIQIWSNVNGRPLDEPEFAPIFERMAAREPADLDPPGPPGVVRRLLDRDEVEVRDVVGLRLALRDRASP